MPELFANEMIEAMISTDALDEVCEDALALRTGIHGRDLRVTRCPDGSLKARYLYSRAQREPNGSDDFIDHLRLIAAEFVSKTHGRYDYDTALRTLCNIVVQTFNLSVALTDNPRFSTSDERYSPNQACLSVACGLGDLDVVTELLSKHDVKMNPTEPPKVHFLSFPIRAAVSGGHKAIVDYLLQHGSGIEAASLDPPFWTIIDDAILNSEPAILAFLLEEELAFPVREPCAGERLGSAYEGALITAAYRDNDVGFNILVERGPIKAPFPEPLQQLVLMAACEGRSLAIARRIFEMNPALDPNYDLKGFVSRRGIMSPLDGQRQCPLQAAAHWGSMALVQLLLDHGADPNWADDYRRSALYRATSQGYDGCKDVLLRAGADADGIEPLG